ncbi:MAG: M20/M25/M40 family metallo-hydrolase [Candidatus Omnitrophota bacterium]|nr:M20/M25/M40 family metallo-hydrolase [Candidatus Omnitrophota bacterium]
MKEEVTRLLQSLVRIDSQNPPGNETAIIEFIKTYLVRYGIVSKIYEFKSGRPNLVCTIPSLHRKRSIIFTPHVDTVPVTGRWRFGALSGTRFAGRIYGRGATDCKANVAVSLALIRSLREKNIRLRNLDLVFAFSADEETGSYGGIIPLAQKLRGIDYGVVLDADDFNIIVAQKGLLHLRVELFGKEAHGAYPERGVNAVERAVSIITEILDRKFSYLRHPLLKKPTINVGRFVGGDKVNIVAGYCFFELDIRYLPSMTQNSIVTRIEKAIRKQKIRYRVTVLAHQEPIEIDTKSPSIKILREVLRRHRIRSALSPSFGATVINFLEAQGIESFAFGFGSKGNAHTKNESVKVSNLHKGVDVLIDYVQQLDAYVGGR